MLSTEKFVLLGVITTLVFFLLFSLQPTKEIQSLNEIEESLRLNPRHIAEVLQQVQQLQQQNQFIQQQLLQQGRDLSSQLSSISTLAQKLDAERKDFVVLKAIVKDLEKSVKKVEENLSNARFLPEEDEELVGNQEKKQEDEVINKEKDESEEEEDNFWLYNKETDTEFKSNSILDDNPDSVIEIPTYQQIKETGKSQFKEDRFVFEHFFTEPFKPRGFYLEVGALDGVRFSNTYMYEKLLKWDGILIEPTPRMYERMVEARAASYKFHGAVCDSPKTITIVTPGNNAVAGNLDTMSENFKESFYKDKGLRSFEVSCNTLTYYINISGRKHVDMIVIDVEGGEYDALLGFDWDNISVGVWVVEISEPELEKSQKIVQLLTVNGYVFKERLSLSEIWYNSRLF